MAVTHDISCDLNFGTTYATDLRPYVDSKSALRISRHRGKISSMTLSLNNSDGRFSTEYAAAAYFGRWGKRGIPIRYRAHQGGPFESLWTGIIWDYKLVGNKSEQRCQIRCVGRMKLVQNQKNPRFAASAARTSTEALEAVLTACGFDSGDWDLAADSFDLSLHYPTGGDGLQECMRIVDSRYGMEFFESKEGLFTSLSGYDLGDNGTGYSPNDTWGEGTNVLTDDNYGGPDLDYRRDDMKSKIEAAYQRFITGTAGSIVVYTHPKNAANGNEITIAAGASITFEAPYILPVHSITTPASTTDFLSASLTVSAVDHGNKAVVTVTNPTGGNLDLDFFQIRGDTLVYRHPRSAATGDAEAIPAYGTLKFTANYFTVATALQSLTIDTDWKGNAAADGSGAAATAANLVITVTDYGIQADVEMRNTTAATIYLTKFQLRGAAVQIEKGMAAMGAMSAMSAMSVVNANPSKGVSVVDGGKIVHSLPLAGLVGEPTEQREYKFSDTSDQLVTWLYMKMRTNRMLAPVLTLPMSWTHDDIRTAAFERELYDLVYYADAGGSGNAAWLTGVKGYFRIVGIDHDIPFGPNAVPVTTFTLWPAWLWWNPAEAVNLFDTFDRADTVSGLGNASPLSARSWSATTILQINSGKAKAITSSTGATTLPTASGIPNQSGELSVSISNLVGASMVPGLISSATAGSITADHVRAVLSYSTGLVALVSRISGSEVTRASKGAADGFTLGPSHELMLRCERNQVSGIETWTVWVDGTKWCESDAINLGFQDHNGLYKSGTTTGVEFDNYAMRTF